MSTVFPVLRLRCRLNLDTGAAEAGWAVGGMCVKSVEVVVGMALLVLGCGLAQASKAAEIAPLKDVLTRGVPTLVIGAADRLSPMDASNPAWADWQELRAAAVQARGGELSGESLPTPTPTDPPEVVVRYAKWQLNQGNTDAARSALAPLANATLPDGLRRQADTIWVGTLLRDGQADDALREAARLLKAPVDPMLATQLTEVALQLEQPDAAVRWASALPADGELAAMAHWQHHDVPDAVLIARLIQAIDRTEPADDAIAAMRFSVAVKLNHGPLIWRAGDRLLARPVLAAGIDPMKVWQAWARQGERMGNQMQLLAGDDDAWWARLHALPAESAWQAGAMLAFLSDQAAEPARRRDAAKEVLSRLSPLTAWRIATAPGWRESGVLIELEPAQRRAIAAAVGDVDALMAVRLWQTVPEENMDAAVTSVSRIRDLARSGAKDEATNRILQLAKSGATNGGSAAWLEAAQAWYEASPESLKQAWPSLMAAAGPSPAAAGWLQRARLSAVLGDWNRTAGDAAAAALSDPALRQQAGWLAHTALLALGRTDEAVRWAVWLTAAPAPAVKPASTGKATKKPARP